MKNIKERICAFSTVAFNMTLGLLLAIFLSSEMRKNTPLHANLRVLSFNRSLYYKKMMFYPGLDLTPQFNCHVRMIFVYLTCKSGNNCEETIWSKIVKNGDYYNLVSLEHSNYPFTADGGRPIILELRGNIFPYVGRIRDVSYGEIVIE